MVMSILPEFSSGAASVASMARSSVLQNVTLAPVFVALFVAASASVSSPELDFALPASEPPSDFEPLSEDEEDEDEELLEDESFPELSLPQAVSERVAATPMAARAVMRVYFAVFPQE
ncbi:hypothetical protein OH786_34545 [Streptomyces atratus]